MNPVIHSRAPGKVVLIGEYAVLDGAPALAMAVDRYARVTLEPGSGRSGTLAAPKLVAEPVGFEIGSDGRLNWQIDAPGWLTLARTASLLDFLHSRVRERFGDPGGYHATIDTSELYLPRDGRLNKLGLGSSSAVAVALDAALRRLAGGAQPSGLSMRAFERLITPYRRGQEGQGSGIDLATSLCGGVVCFQRHGERAEVERLSLPDGLVMVFVWTGQPASTADFLGHFRRWQAAQPAAARATFAAMERVSKAAVKACRGGDGEALMACLRDYGGLMGKMGDEMGVAVETAAHRRIREVAEGLGMVYKPCGAGGGDIGMAVASDAHPAHEFSARLQADGWPILPLGADMTGVEVRSGKTNPDRHNGEP